jgi:tRNA threonylcarbamoyladenosine dehydratase
MPVRQEETDPRFARGILFARMLGILTPKELDVLARKTVAVPGGGGVGFTHAESLARMGVGRMKIADFDTFDPINFGRQFGATIHTIGRSKVEVLLERLKSINPAIVVDTFDGVSENNIDRFLDGVDMACDAIDYFAIGARRLMYREARARGIPVIIAGPVGFGATMHLFDSRGTSFDEYFDLHEGQSEEDELLNFGIGLGPAELFRHSLADRNLDFKNRTGSVLSSTCLLCSALVGTVALAHLLGRKMAIKPVPHVYQIDIAAGKFVELHIPEGVRAIKANPQAYRR